ncbi:MAG: metallophosphoesterase [Sedimentisphaerales bacterium]
MRPISEIRLLVENQEQEQKEKVQWCWGVLDFLLRVSLIRSVGLRNALDVRVENVELVFGHLPKGFDNIRILFVTDLHLDGTNPLADKVLSVVGNIDYDYCILGGDYTYGRNEDPDQVYSQIKRIAELLKTKSRVFGILGNYDLYRIAELLEGRGVEMLINEGIYLERKGDKIYLAGMDDPSHYKADDIVLTDGNTWDGAFKIMVCHSPAKYKESAGAEYSLYLAGDTHGGQICLPGGIVVFCGPTAGRKMASGKWSYNGMVGYTSRGVGTSRIKMRYFCPPEITVITLRNGRR